jgi:shikimate kinase
LENPADPPDRSYQSDWHWQQRKTTLKHIFLTGFMGSGKTSVGRVLARRLGCPFVDLDQVIVDTAGCSIKDIFAAQGEPAFRELESQALQKVAQGDPCIVSTGGGVVLATANRAVMRSCGSIVNLTASVEAIAARLSGDSERPLLQGDPSFERVRTMMELREPCYADADLRIDTSDKLVAAVAEEIIKNVRGEQ